MWKYVLVVWVMVGGTPHRLEVTPMPDAETCVVAVEDALARGPEFMTKFKSEVTLFQAACELTPGDPPA
jgi:hypothetical protein